MTLWGTCAAALSSIELLPMGKTYTEEVHGGLSPMEAAAAVRDEYEEQQRQNVMN